MAAKDWKNETLTAPPSWDGNNLKKSLNELFDLFVFKPTTDAVRWYFDQKKKKRISGLILRLVSIGCAGAGIVIPMLAELVGPIRGYEIQAGWASVALVVSAGLVWVDRLVGATSGWMRYVASGLEASALRDKAILRWSEVQGTWSNPPTGAEILVATAVLRELNTAIHEVVRKETAEWMSEFRSSLDQIDTLVKSHLQERQKAIEEGRVKAEAPKTGILNVTISNPNALQCKITATQGQDSKESNGRQAAFTEVLQGQWKITAQGKIRDDQNAERDAAATQAVMVKAGETTPVTLTLVL